MKFTEIRKTLVVLLAAVFLLGACSKDSVNESVIVIRANGDINGKLNEFRNILGITLNVVPGASGGRREINWDAVPAELVNKALPGDFFNPTSDGSPAARQRGLVYSAGGGEFIASNNGFAAVNAAAANQFSAFSGDKAFANISSNLWDAEFRVPGQTSIATVKGFGIVFADVDKENNAFIEFFNEAGSLGKFYAPAKSAGSNFSFLGVYFKNERVTKVRIGHEDSLASGDKDISNGGAKDLVVFDDFLYDEPVKK